MDLSRLLPMLSPGTWAASSQVIGELEQHQDLVVFDIQTSKPFEAWSMLIRAETMMLLEHWSTNLAEQLTLISETLHQVRGFDGDPSEGSAQRRLNKDLTELLVSWNRSQ